MELTLKDQWKLASAKYYEAHKEKVLKRKALSRLKQGQQLRPETLQRFSIETS
jgi:hypothetical protein